MFQRLQTYITFLFVSVLFLPDRFVRAQGLQNAAKELEGAGKPAGVNTIEPDILVGQIIQFVIGFTGVIFLALTVYGGVLWMTAQGNESQVEKARHIIVRAIIGLAIVMLSYAITLAISAVFGI